MFLITPESQEVGICLNWFNLYTELTKLEKKQCLLTVILNLHAVILQQMLIRLCFVLLRLQLQDKNQ